MQDLGFALPVNAQADDFDERVFVGGWFPMIPLAGIPGRGDVDLLMHGEAARLRWDVLSATEHELRCRLLMPRSGLTVDRIFTVEGRSLTIFSRVTNDSGVRQELTVGEHPCLDRSVFECGAIVLDARRGFITAEASSPHATRYATDQTFVWPEIRLRGGGSVDASIIPSQDGRHDHVCLELHRGTVAATAPRLGGQLRLDVSDVLSSLLYWQHYLPSDSPWQGDTLGLEFCSAPGRTLDDARDARAVSAIEPGEALEWRISATWSAT